MRHLTALALLLAALLVPVSGACGEVTLSDALDQVIDGLDTAALEEALQTADPFAATGGFRETLRKIARGELTLSFDDMMRLLLNRFASAWTGSLWRITRLCAPAIIWSILRRLSGRSAEAGQVVCSLLVCVFLSQDLSEHSSLCLTTMDRMSSGMQGLFPLLLTMMAAVGGSAGSALLQPAVVTAASSMTGLIRHVTVPLTAGAAVLTMLCYLGDGVRVTRLAKLLRQLASWSLGVCFTVFIGVLATRGVTAAAVDGVTIRTAKYAMDNLIPVVGGLFADTVDALIGSGMLVQSALGVTGLLLIVSWCIGPMCQTLAAAVLYKLTAAVMQPVSDGPLADCIHEFSELLMLLFIIQLCAAAMFLMLIAQLIAVSGMTMMLR